MRWIGWLVAVVFILGVILLGGAVAMVLRSAEGVPSMPLMAGLLGLVVLILLAGACLALISIAVTLRRGIEALGAVRPAAQPALPLQAVEEARLPQENQSYQFDPEPPARPARAGRALVATR